MGSHDTYHYMDIEDQGERQFYNYCCDQICKNLPSTHKRHKMITSILFGLNYNFSLIMLHISASITRTMAEIKLVVIIIINY